jgi:hypothetical protein
MHILTTFKVKDNYLYFNLEKIKDTLKKKTSLKDTNKMCKE